MLVHLEAAEIDNEPSFVWWAESPQLEGSTSAADHLPDLLQQCDDAIPAIALEMGLGVVEILSILWRVDNGTVGTAHEDHESEPSRVVVVQAA